MESIHNLGSFSSQLSNSSLTLGGGNGAYHHSQNSGGFSFCFCDIIGYNRYLWGIGMTKKELEERLAAVTNQLLDLGKRNRLLNYKDQGLKT